MNVLRRFPPRCRRNVLSLHLAAAIALSLSAGCDAPTAGGGVAEETLAAEAAGPTGPDVVDLGVVPAGGRQAEVVQFVNHGRNPKSITSIETSCPCVSVTFDVERVAGMGRAFARVAVDFREDPDFTGDLLIRVRGTDEAGEEVVAFEVEVCVVSAEAMLSFR